MSQSQQAQLCKLNCGAYVFWNRSLKTGNEYFTATPYGGSGKPNLHQCPNYQASLIQAGQPSNFNPQAQPAQQPLSQQIPGYSTAPPAPNMAPQQVPQPQTTSQVIPEPETEPEVKIEDVVGIWKSIQEEFQRRATEPNYAKLTADSLDYLVKELRITNERILQVIQANANEAEPKKKPTKKST